MHRIRFVDKIVIGFLAFLSAYCSRDQRTMEAGASSELQGAITAGKSFFTPPKPKSALELSRFRQSLVATRHQIKGQSSRSANPRLVLRSSLYRGILAQKGVPRQQITPTLKSLLATSSTACGGGSCSRIFALGPNDVDSYLDDSFDVAAKDQTLAQPQNKAARQVILSSLARPERTLSPNGSAASDLAETIAKAHKIADSQTKFLAYGFASTGCDYRAFYTAMELAAERIAPKAIYNSARTGFKFVPGPGITWEYHVATTFTVNGQEFVFDPTFKSLGVAGDAILSKQDWFVLTGAKKQGFWEPSHGENPSREFYFPGSFSLLENLRVREQGSTVYLEGDELAEFLAKQKSTRFASFDETPPFTIKDINEACRNMTYLIQKENANAVDIQKALIARTEHLITRLEQLGKLNRNAIFQCVTR